VLHGVGGSTIEEAKRNVSVVEFYRWCQYVRLRGTLNVAEKLESVGALIAWIGTRSGMQPMKKADGTLFEMRDFMPHADPLVEEQEPRELTVDDFMRVLGKGKK
jgi:hypothetical protein